MSIITAINSDLLAWAKSTLAPWQHEAFRRILSNGSLTDTDYSDILERAQIDLGLVDFIGPRQCVELTSVDLPPAPPASARVYLKKIKGLQGINVLKAGLEIAIGPNLTVLYGENGSGKSGYARVLKKVARCPVKAVDQILPDVFSAAASPAIRKATFELEEAGVVTPIDWQDGVTTPEAMQRFAVFDSKCARSFLTSDNEVSFVPSTLEALRHVSNCIDEIKRRLLSLASQAAPVSPPAYQLMVEGKTEVGRALGAISLQTDATTISSLAVWSAANSEDLSSKEKELQQLRAASPQLVREQLTREIRDLTTLQTTLSAVADALGDAKIGELKEKIATLAKESESVRVAVKLAFGDSQFEGVGSETWKSLIEAAAKFSTNEAYKQRPFPVVSPEAVCLLCQQPLSEPAATRLTRFWEFLREDAATKRDEAQNQVANSLSAMRVVPEDLPAVLVPLATEFRQTQSSLWDLVVSFFASARARLAQIEAAAEAGKWETVPALETAAGISCESAIAEKRKLLAEVKDDEQVQLRIKELESAIEELNARKRLSENVNLVLDHLAALKRSHELRTKANSLSTNSITIKARHLFTTHITDAFKAEVAKKIKLLGIRSAKVAVEEKPGKGKVLQSISLHGAKVPVQPEEVLSEGERTAISLSYFLADLGSPETTAGIIFDDPVTSLDHRIRDGVVKALVPEAKIRQVIVFTHDLAFFCELMSRARFELVDAVPYYIESFNGTAGLVQAETPWDAMTVKDRIGKLQVHAVKAKGLETAGDVDGYRNEVARFYGRLRATWERSIEELLFNEVISRYERAVQTMRLRGVDVTKDAITKVFDAMTRCSAIIDAHDHAAAATVPMPSSADMESDLVELRDFVKTQRGKIDAAQKANAHLAG